MQERSTTAQFSTRQEQVIQALLAGQTRPEAASASGVSSAEVDRWLETDSVFVATMNRRRKDLHEAQVERLRSLAADAVEALRDLLGSENESIRLRAATALIRAVGLAEVSVPTGETTAAGVEQVWRRNEFIDSLSAI